MEPTEKTHEGQIFINGKSQIIEMLKFMNPAEKQILLNNMRNRNPQLVRELTQHDISFTSFFDLSDTEITQILSKISAPILGLSIKNISQNLQKRILCLAPKSYAQEAFGIMNSQLSNENDMIVKARKKITQLLIHFHKSGSLFPL